MRIRQFLAAAALLGAFPAFAQTEPGEQNPPKKVRVIYKAVEEITFDPVIIDGEDVRPVGMFINGHEDVRFPTMIEERVHFKRDLVKSIGVATRKLAKTTEITP